MIGYIIRRLLMIVPVMGIVTLIVFILSRVGPGDPAAIMLGTSASPDTLAALRQELGLDQPLPVRYVLWLGGVLTGDLGTSYTYGVPVAGLIAERTAGRVWGTVAAAVAGEVVLMTLGVAFLAWLIGVESAVTYGLVPFVLGDLLKIVLAVAVARGIGRLSLPGAR